MVRLPAGINIKATVSVGPYLGYYGTATYDNEANLFHGDVTGTRDVITFQSREMVGLDKEFKASVDSYLAFCKTNGREPNKPYSGKLIVRLEPEQHRDLAVRAEFDHTSINTLIARSVTTFLNKVSPKNVAHVTGGRSTKAGVSKKKAHQPARAKRS